MKNIILCCNAGMSTSMLVKKMQEAAKKDGIDVKIDAIPIDDLSSNLDGTGVVLLGPQVKFMKGKAEEVIGDRDIKVDSINMMDYGMMKGDNVLKTALSLMEK